MTAEQKLLIRKSFQVVERVPLVAALVFYRRLFELNSRLKPLFKTDIEAQSRKLMEMLGILLSLLEKPERLTAELEALGARHVAYGVREEHYATVGQALLDMLSEVLGSDFTPAMREAWKELYGFIRETMLKGTHACAVKV